MKFSDLLSDSFKQIIKYRYPLGAMLILTFISDLYRYSLLEALFYALIEFVGVLIGVFCGICVVAWYFARK